ncbi:MAG: prolyl oligopeptidase family serine peptidase [Bryobacteraceae bacterium]
MKLGLLASAVAWCADSNSSKISRVIDQLEAVHSFSGVTISPDGHWVTWSEPAPGGASGRLIYLADRTRPASKPARVTAVVDGTSFVTEQSLAWAPDSHRFAFLSYANDPKQEQIYLANVGSEIKPRKLTQLAGYVTDLRWTPDGQNIGFLYAAGGGGGGPLEAAKVETGVIGSAIHNQQLNLVTPAGEATRAVSPVDLNVYEYDWAPDGQKYVAIAAPGPADNNWWTAKMYVGSTKTGVINPFYAPPIDQQIAIPRWSPDGQHIAFVGGLMSDEGFVGGDLFTLEPEQKGEPKNLTAGRRSSVTSLQWQRPDRLLITEDVNGSGAIGTVTVSSGEIETLWQGNELLHVAGNLPNLSVAADGIISASIRSTWEAPPEVWSGPFGNWASLTHANADQKPQWGKSEKINWTVGNLNTEGWLLYPEGFDPAKRYPMVVSVHGGPASMRESTWPTVHFDMSVMASLGYFVFFPNPRGSYGEGEAFTRANVKDFGHGDLEDILAGVDAILRKAPVDPNRLGVTGWSYGGFMTMWTVTQTNRFRAAVAGAGISNWKSYYGENLIDRWMIPYFGASVYDSPQAYAKSSPIEYIKQVKTPTLVVVGELDAECPAPQSYEFWHALKTLGVPTQLIVYPGEGHSFRTVEHRKDVLRRTADWFDQNLH